MVDLPESGGHAATRTALLEAAADVFAHVGFQNATIREICQKAGANVAAVNYHFRDKEGLYSEVLRVQGRLAESRFPSTADLADDASHEQRLEVFIRSFLQRVLSEEIANRHGRMMAREMVEPTAALDQLVRHIIQPQANLLHEIVGSLLPPGTPSETVRLHSLSIVGQILFYAHCRPVLSRLEPRSAYDFTELDQLTQHITRFSLAALRDFSAARPRARTTPSSRSRTSR
jgi:TetR/AcrR family transcriptional regulator, regulator of cefoperazone and chloramphenicol sensitivity